MDDANELLFHGFRIADQDFLTHLYFQRQVDQGTVGVDHRGKSVFGYVMFIRAAGNDQNGHAQENPLTAAPVVHRREIGRESGHEYGR